MQLSKSVSKIDGICNIFYLTLPTCHTYSNYAFTIGTISVINLLTKKVFFFYHTKNEMEIILPFTNVIFVLVEIIDLELNLNDKTFKGIKIFGFFYIITL